MANQESSKNIMIVDGIEIPEVIQEYFRSCHRPLEGYYYNFINLHVHKDCEECEYRDNSDCIAHERFPIRSVLCCGHPRLRQDLIENYVRLNIDKIPDLIKKYCITGNPKKDIANLVRCDCWMSGFGKNENMCGKCNNTDCIAQDSSKVELLKAQKTLDIVKHEIVITKKSLKDLNKQKAELELKISELEKDSSKE